MIEKDIAPMTRHDSGDNAVDVKSVVIEDLPDSEAATTESNAIPANDGTSPDLAASHMNLTCSDSGAAESKITTKASTFREKLKAPAERKPPNTESPIKAIVATPPRGRPRHHNSSPNGRPLSVDQHFTLSPSHSGTHGSRGILTFNIKARISPGRGVGSRDDTELFVTADVESDGSDEGH